MSEDTVSFNVGGRIFEVRRSLLESFPTTILARSASEEWRKGSNQQKPIFLDRDSDCSWYCLDYMRDGKVQLPHTESRAALLEDMKYYNFEDVNHSVTAIDFPVADALKCLALFDKSMKSDIARAELRLQHTKLARDCFDEHKNSFSLRLYISKSKHEES